MAYSSLLGTGGTSGALGSMGSPQVGGLGGQQVLVLDVLKESEKQHEKLPQWAEISSLDQSICFQGGYSNTGTSCSERWWNIHPWGCSRLVRAASANFWFGYRPWPQEGSGLNFTVIPLLSGSHHLSRGVLWSRRAVDADLGCGKKLLWFGTRLLSRDRTQRANEH